MGCNTDKPTLKVDLGEVGEMERCCFTGVEFQPGEMSKFWGGTGVMGIRTAVCVWT